MAFSEYLADRIRQNLDDKHLSYVDKKMMGGLTFMIDDKMCVGIIKDDLLARINPDIYESSLEKEGCKEMKFTGRPMKGFVLIEAEAIDDDADLDYWIQLCLDFNPLAKSSKKKK